LGTAVDIATKAADQLFQYQVLGIVAVILLLMLVGVTVFAWRRIDAKDKQLDAKSKELVEAHIAWKNESISSRESVVGALKTVDNALAILMRGRR